MEGQIRQLRTHFILKLLHPIANDNSWWPRQIPKRGFGLSTDTCLRMFPIVALDIVGSPGPLLKKIPSYSKIERSKWGLIVFHSRIHHITHSRYSGPWSNGTRRGILKYMSEPKTDQTFSRIQISIESLAILVFLTNKFLNCFSTKDVMKIG